MIIDAHQHFWNPRRGDYGWIPTGDAVLDRAYRPADLWPQMLECGVDSTILVQAAPTIEETEYLLGIADAAPFVGGVVGWINFEDPREINSLERIARVTRLRGLRPMIQDIDDEHWMLKPDLDWAYRALTEKGLVFDALGKPRHLPHFLTLARRYPDLTIVLDHCMKPDIANHTNQSFATWAEGISRLAALPQVHCKLSGLVTEAIGDWSIEDLRPYTDHVLAEFGAGRVMWGSDWPVVRGRAEYAAWYEAARQLTAHCSAEDQTLLFGTTAARVYDLTI